MSPTQLKTFAKLDFLRAHKDNQNFHELLRVTKNRNITIMADRGWQYADSMIEMIVRDLAKELKIKQ